MPAKRKQPRAEKFPLTNASTQTERDVEYRRRIGRHFEHGAGTTLDRLNHFARFVPRQSLSLFLARHEAFRGILEVQGSIVECGVFLGGGLFTWAQLSAIYEPVNHLRHVIGFDTFSGFPHMNARDATPGARFDHKSRGSYRFDAVEELRESMALFDLNRNLGHMPKIELVRGDATRTIPRFVRQNQHIVVALLSLDFDLYAPTLSALKHFLPRMPKGAIIVFDELNQKQWPGETRALLDAVGISRLRIKRFPFTPALSYAVLA